MQLKCLKMFKTTKDMFYKQFKGPIMELREPCQNLEWISQIVKELFKIKWTQYRCYNRHCQRTLWTVSTYSITFNALCFMLFHERELFWFFTGTTTFYLRAQAVAVQGLVSVPLPLHGLPCGAPERLYSHVRVLNEVALPQDALHAE